MNVNEDAWVNCHYLPSGYSTHESAQLNDLILHLRELLLAGKGGKKTGLTFSFSRI